MFSSTIAQLTEREGERRGREREREGGKEGEERRREREKKRGREKAEREGGKSQSPWRISDWAPGQAYPPISAGHRGQGQETHLPFDPPLWCVDLAFTEKQRQTPVLDWL